MTNNLNNIHHEEAQRTNKLHITIVTNNKSNDYHSINYIAMIMIKLAIQRLKTRQGIVEFVLLISTVLLMYVLLLIFS